MGTPDGRIATASQPGSPGAIEIESADDFILGSQTTIDHATFTGLLPSGAPLSSVQQVVVEIYRVFPKDSTDPLLGHVPTGVNSPSDVASDSRDNAAANLTFTSFASGTFHGCELSLSSTADGNPGHVCALPGRYELRIAVDTNLV